MRPIEDVAADLDLVPADIQPWGPGVAKVRSKVAFRARGRRQDHLRRRADPGRAGAQALAETIVSRARSASPTPRFVYDLKDAPEERIRKIARAIYGASDVDFTVTACSSRAR
jgi:formyltetrahydrofolate synthetase